MARSGRKGDAGAAGEGPSDSAPTTLADRARNKTQLRAALALEEAGELHEAARLFEYVGEHAQAASLRLEHANTLRDERQRLMVLREGAARNPGDSGQGRQLHKALARALLNHATGLEAGPRRRALSMEAAQALEEADEGEAAGDIYEQLGLLHDAARAFESAGAVTRLELVLAVLDRREQVEKALEATRREVEFARQMGRRRLARDMLLDHVRSRQNAGLSPRAELARILAALEDTLMRRRRFTVELRGGDEDPCRAVILGTERLRMGRAPDAELTLAGAALSREHAEIRVGTDRGEARLVVLDLGSRAGTFLDGEPLEPGIPTVLDTQHELALGLAQAVELHPCPTPHQALLLRAAGDAGWTYYAPLGGVLRLAPDREVPGELRFEDPHVVLQLDPEVWSWLEDEPLGPGATIELLAHDTVFLQHGTHAAGPAGPKFELRILDAQVGPAVVR